MSTLDFAQIVRRRLRETGQSLHGAAVSHGLPRDAMRNVVGGHIPRLDRATEIADALGLEFYIGPPRSDAPSQPAEPSNLTLGVQSRIEDLEKGVHQIVRVVVDAGGNPIPEDLWPVLDERRGVAAVPVRAVQSGDASPELSAANDEDSLTIPYANDVRAAAGAGEIVFEETADMRITIPRSILPGWTRPRGLICIRTAGDSMEPTLNDGDMLLMDRLSAEPLDGHIFVLHTEDGLVVKRLRQEDEGWEMTSDNSAYPSRPVGERDRIAGRLAWSGPLRATEAHAGWSLP